MMYENDKLIIPEKYKKCLFPNLEKKKIEYIWRLDRVLKK